MWGRKRRQPDTRPRAKDRGNEVEVGMVSVRVEIDGRAIIFQRSLMSEVLLGVVEGEPQAQLDMSLMRFRFVDALIQLTDTISRPEAEDIWRRMWERADA